MSHPRHPEPPEQFADCVYTRAQIDQALDKLAADIATRLSAQYPLVISVLNGGLIVAGHLLTRLAFPLQLDYIHATRYRGARTGSDQLHWQAPPHTELRGRHVLLVDDIFDEGYTLQALEAYCREKGAASVASAVLLRKRHPRPVAAMTPAFIALDVEDRYVFGFGMDVDHEWRNANGIYALRET
jgi:hypoxanthine phosphoribosyltransferase